MIWGRAPVCIISDKRFFNSKPVILTLQIDKSLGRSRHGIGEDFNKGTGFLSETGWKLAFCPSLLKPLAVH